MVDDLALEGKPFEELLEMLQQTVALLDSDHLTLAEAVAAYERCARIAKACELLLDDAELRITKLNETTQGVRETSEVYAVNGLSARRLLLGDDDDLGDLLDYDEEP